MVSTLITFSNVFYRMASHRGLSVEILSDFLLHILHSNLIESLDKSRTSNLGTDKGIDKTSIVH